MPKIKLTKTENVSVSDKPILIINSSKEKGYKTVQGFKPFGSVIVDSINDIMLQIEEIEREYDCSTYGIGYQDYIEMNNGGTEINYSALLSAIKNKNFDNLEKLILDNSITLPFGVSVYDDKPVLYYKGFLHELLLYDILMVVENNINIKFCKSCGYAFISNSNKLYCDKEECQDAKRLKKCVNTSPIVSKRKLLYNKMIGREFTKAEYAYQTDFFNKLAQIFLGDTNKTKEFYPQELEKRISDWEQIYEKIMKITKYMRKKATEKDLISLWKTESENISISSTIQDINEWIERWEQLIHL